MVTIETVPNIYQARTISIKGCLSFSIENRGTTLVEVSFDSGESWLDVLPDSHRSLPPCSGDVYEGEMRIRFGGVVDPAAVPSNKANIIKQLFKCSN